MIPFPGKVSAIRDVDGSVFRYRIGHFRPPAIEDSQDVGLPQGLGATLEVAFQTKLIGIALYAFDDPPQDEVDALDGAGRVLRQGVAEGPGALFRVGEGRFARPHDLPASNDGDQQSRDNGHERGGTERGTGHVRLRSVVPIDASNQRWSERQEDDTGLSNGRSSAAGEDRPIRHARGAPAALAAAVGLCQIVGDA